MLGHEKINQAFAIAQEAQKLFNQRLYVEAGLEYEKALELDGLEYSYFENAASSFFMAGDYGKALIYSDKVINKLNPKTGKSEYINALVHFNIGGAKLACQQLQKAIDFGFTQAQETYDQRCNTAQ